MDRALLPGMRLMRRMGITTKFSVVTLLLLLPLTIGVGSGFAESTGRLRAVDQERAGLRLAAPLVQLVIQLAQTQDAAARGIPPTRGLPAVGSVDAAVAEVGAQLRVADTWRQARPDLDALSAPPPPERAVTLAASALRRCTALLKQVADSSGLVADAQLDTAYVTKSLVSTLPRLLVVVAATSDGTEPGDTSFEQRYGLRTLTDRAAGLEDDVNTAAATTSWPSLWPRLNRQLAAVTAAISQYSAAVVGKTLAHPGVTPLGSGSLAAASADLATQLSDSLDTLLERRQDQLAASRIKPVLLALGSLLVLGYLLVAVYRATSQDVHAVLEDISTVTSGQQPAVPPLEGSDEFARMSRAVTITRDRLTSLLGSLRYQATHDELTALGNRSLFTDKVDEALAEHGPGVAVVVVDLDHFRDVNDSFGHDMGDRILRAVGVRFHRAVGRQNVVARLGSDEFGVLLPRGGGEDAAREVVGRLH